MVVLRGERVLLRRGRPEDAARLFQIWNEPEVARRWGADDIEEEIGEQFIEADEGFVIEADGEVVGAIQYHEENEPMYRHAGIDIFLRDLRLREGVLPPGRHHAQLRARPRRRLARRAADGHAQGRVPPLIE
jgi:aminoglycoside 6'-N-acetyltransferase